MAKNSLVQVEELSKFEWEDSVQNDLVRINTMIETFLEQPEKYPEEQAKLLKAICFGFFHHYLDEITYFTDKQYFVGTDYFKDGNFTEEKELCKMYEDYREKWAEICKIKFALDEVKASGKDPKTVFEEYKENKISRLDGHTFNDDRQDDFILMTGRDSESSSSMSTLESDEAKIEDLDIVMQNMIQPIGICNDDIEVTNNNSDEYVHEDV